MPASGPAGPPPLSRRGADDNDRRTEGGDFAVHGLTRKQQKSDSAVDQDGFGPSPRLYQRAYELLAQQIRKGELPGGAGLTETAVAAQFGISRAPARRALAELQDAGLVEKAPGRGFAVKRGARAVLKTKADQREFLRGDSRDLRLISESSWERIYREVESELAARISFASWRLNEAELARYYRVSRTVARDVIGRLQQRGVVRKDDRSRWLAPALTPQRVGELYELRWLLEPAALIKAVERLPDGLLDTMRLSLDQALRKANEVEGPTLDRLERDLHVTLLGYCANETLMQAITQPQSLLIAHRFLYRWTARLFKTEPFLPEHLDIIEKLQAGRTKPAARSLERHLRDSRDRAIARIDVIAKGPQPEPCSYLEPLPG